MTLKRNIGSNVNLEIGFVKYFSQSTRTFKPHIYHYEFGYVPKVQSMGRFFRSFLTCSRVTVQNFLFILILSEFW